MNVLQIYVHTHGCLGTYSLYRVIAWNVKERAVKMPGCKWVGGGGGAEVGLCACTELHFCTARPGIQGVDQYNETGPLIYHLFGNVIAFLAPRVFFCHRATFKHSKINLKTSLLNSFISYSIPWPFSTFLKKKIQWNVALLCLLSFVVVNKAFSTVAIAHNYTAFNGSVLAPIRVQRSL